RAEQRRWVGGGRPSREDPEIARSWRLDRVFDQHFGERVLAGQDRCQAGGVVDLEPGAYLHAAKVTVHQDDPLAGGGSRQRESARDRSLAVLLASACDEHAL